MTQLPPRECVRAVRDFSLEHALWKRGDRIVVGVSGGSDSMALLSILHHLSPAWRLRLHVAHLDHGVRRGSGMDAAFVVATAERLGWPCTVAREPVRAIAAREKRSLEEAGRLVRYDFFTRLARRVGAARVAVAHHADDQAETILMRLIRGAAATGLAGIPASRPLAPGLRLIRPLLGVNRATLLGYLRQPDPAAQPHPP
jgi:tRNA(Ile)-lysidine synthase